MGSYASSLLSISLTLVIRFYAVSYVRDSLLSRHCSCFLSHPCLLYLFSFVRALISFPRSVCKCVKKEAAGEQPPAIMTIKFDFDHEGPLRPNETWVHLAGALPRCTFVPISELLGSVRANSSAPGSWFAVRCDLVSLLSHLWQNRFGCLHGLQAVTPSFERLT